MPTFSLIVPCYNEASSLQAIFKRAVDAAKKNELSAKDFRLVMVNNGSLDQSKIILEQLKKSEDGQYLDVVEVFPNIGYGNGLLQGLNKTQTDFVGWTHADEQTDLNDAFRALDLLNRTKDEKTLVKGTRRGRALKDKIITLGYQFFALIILHRNISEINAQPKVFPRELLSKIKNPPLDFAFDLFVLLKALESGYKVEEIAVQFPPRKHGHSSWATTYKSKFRTISRMINFMLRYKARKI